MSNLDLSRDEFEQTYWNLSHRGIHVDREDLFRKFTVEHKIGEYINPAIQNAWLFWQKGREALLVNAESAGFQRRSEAHGWVTVNEEDIPHYKKQGQPIRELFAGMPLPAPENNAKPVVWKFRFNTGVVSFVDDEMEAREISKNLGSNEFETEFFDKPSTAVPTSLIQQCRLQIQEISKLRGELKLRQQKEVGEVWYWEQDGENNLESLSCPVVIPVEQLKQFIGGPRDVAGNPDADTLYNLLSDAFIQLNGALSSSDDAHLRNTVTFVAEDLSKAGFDVEDTRKKTRGPN